MIASRIHTVCIRLVVLTILTCIGSADPSRANGAVVFFTDRTTFEAALSSQTDINFEGIVADNQFSTPASSTTVGGVEFSISSGSLVVAGKMASLPGQPYASALLAAVSKPASLTADLTTVGSSFTAVGGFFGSLDSDDTTSLTLTGASGVLDTQSVTAKDMGASGTANFYGWTVTGDTIVSVTHDVQGSSNFEGIDDFVYGIAGSSTPIPEPSSLVLVTLGIGGLACMRQRHRRRRRNP